MLAWLGRLVLFVGQCVVGLGIILWLCAHGGEVWNAVNPAPLGQQLVNQAQTWRTRLSQTSWLATTEQAGRQGEQTLQAGQVLVAPTLRQAQQASVTVGQHVQSDLRQAKTQVQAAWSPSSAASPPSHG